MAADKAKGQQGSSAPHQRPSGVAHHTAKIQKVASTCDQMISSHDLDDLDAFIEAWRNMAQSLSSAPGRDVADGETAMTSAIQKICRTIAPPDAPAPQFVCELLHSIQDLMEEGAMPISTGFQTFLPSLTRFLQQALQKPSFPHMLLARAAVRLMNVATKGRSDTKALLLSAANQPMLVLVSKALTNLGDWVIQKESLLLLSRLRASVTDCALANTLDAKMKLDQRMLAVDTSSDMKVESYLSTYNTDRDAPAPISTALTKVMYRAGGNVFFHRGLIGVSCRFNMHSIFLRLPYDDAPHAPGDTGESLDLEIQYGKLRLVDMSEKMPVLTMQLSQNLPITPELMEQGETLSEPYELILTFERDAHRRFGNRLMELFEERLTATDDLATQTPVAAASTHSQPEATSPHEQGDAQLGPKTSVTVDLISIDRPTYHCEIMSRPSNQIMKPASVAYKDPVDERVDDAPATPQLTKADAVTDEAPAHDPIQKDANAEAEADATGVLDADVHDVDGSWDIPGEPTAKPSAKPKPRPHSRNSKSTAASTKSKSEKQVSKSKKGSPITDLDADSHGKPSGKPSYARSTELPWSAPSSHSKRPKRLAKEQASANLSSMLRDDHDSIDEVALLSDASNAPEEVTPWKAHRQSKRDVPPPTRPNTPVDLHTSSLAVTAMPVSRPTAKRSAPESVHPIDSLDYEADEVGPVPGDGAMDSEIGDSDGDLAQYVPRIREAIARKKRQRLEAEQARKQTQLDAAAEQRQQRQRLKEQQQQRQRPVELKHAKQRAQEKNEAKHLRPTTALLPANESDMDRLDSHFVDLDPDVLDSPDSVFLLPSDRHGTQRRGHPHRQDDRAPPALMDALAATTTPTSKVTAVPMQAFWRRWTGDLSQFLTLAMGQSAPIRQIAKIQSQHLELSKNMLKQLESQLAASQRRYHAQVAGEDTREWARQSAHDVQKQSERLNRCDATIYKQLRSLGEYRVNPFARPMQ